MSEPRNPEPAPVEGRGNHPFKRYLRGLGSWRVLRRWLFGLACLATLTGLFYAVENWRGKRAWEQCRRELEAKGQVLDWNAYIPAPVPDDQNIFKAPRMVEWFVKGLSAGSASGGTSNSHNPAAPFIIEPAGDAGAGPVQVVEVTVVTSDAPLPPGKADAVLRLDDPGAWEQVAGLVRSRIGPCALAPRHGVTISRPLDEIKPVSLVVQADKAPTTKDLARLLPRSPVPGSSNGPGDPDYFKVEEAGGNGFRVLLKAPVYAPAGYLDLSQPLVPDFEVLRKALERPFARMDSDYQQLFLEVPIPHFVRMRAVVQMLSQRAQCYLLLGQPEAAWRELALVRDMCRLLEAKPAGNCPTLVAAMIDVAITGLYAAIVQDGLRLGAWREPELEAMQNQLHKVNLLPLLHNAMNTERAAVCRMFETVPCTDWYSPGKGRAGLWARLKDPELLAADLLPRGWIYQNLSSFARFGQLGIEAFDVPNNQVLPRTADAAYKRIHATYSHRTPYTMLAGIALPNFARASQTMARYQTLANEAYIACGLERYRLAHGQYPESLEALVPQFAEKLPHDIIGGLPLKYHRTDDGKFVLYSVGWNEKDDGGVAGKTGVEGDWVWQ